MIIRTTIITTMLARIIAAMCCIWITEWRQSLGVTDAIYKYSADSAKLLLISIHICLIDHLVWMCLHIYIYIWIYVSVFVNNSIDKFRFITINATAQALNCWNTIWTTVAHLFTQFYCVRTFQAFQDTKGALLHEINKVFV